MRRGFQAGSVVAARGRKEARKERCPHQDRCPLFCFRPETPLQRLLLVVLLTFILRLPPICWRAPPTCYAAPAHPVCPSPGCLFALLASISQLLTSFFARLGIKLPPSCQKCGVRRARSAPNKLVFLVAKQLGSAGFHYRSESHSPLVFPASFYCSSGRETDCAVKVSGLRHFPKQTCIFFLLLLLLLL